MASNIGDLAARAALGLEGFEIAVDGVRLAVSDSAGGAGPPVLCLHAAGHGSRDFERLIELGPRRRWLTVDWPGHGRSHDDPQPATASRYAALLSGVIDALQLDQVVLLGNSVGGAAAIEVAATRPDRVAALVLVDSGGLAPDTGFVRAFCRGMAWAYRHSQAWWFPHFFHAQYRALLKGPHARKQRDRIVAAGRAHAGVLAELWTSFAQPERDVRRDLPALRCPVWLAWARHDPYNSLRLVGPTLAQLGTPTLYPGGHAPFLEQPSAFSGDLEAFLDEAVGSTGLAKSAPSCSAS